MGQKKKQRTAEYFMNARHRVARFVACDSIEQHNFRNLVRSGVVREVLSEREMKKVLV